MDQEEVMQRVPLTEPERNKRARELAQAVARLEEHQEKAREAKKDLKYREDKLQAEVRRLARAVNTGIEEINAQADLPFGDN